MRNIYRKNLKKESFTKETIKSTKKTMKNYPLKMRAAGRKFNVPESSLTGKMKQKDFEMRKFCSKLQLAEKTKNK